MFNVKYHVHYANVRLLYSDLKMTWSRWRCLDRWRGHLISSGRVKGVQLPPHDNPPGDCQGFLCGELVPLFPIQCGMGLGVFSGNTKTRRASSGVCHRLDWCWQRAHWTTKHRAPPPTTSCHQLHDVFPRSFMLLIFFGMEFVAWHDVRRVGCLLGTRYKTGAHALSLNFP